MFELLELVARKNGIDTFYIFNNLKAIENDISKLCEAEYMDTIENIIILVLKYNCGNEKKHYQDIFEYAEMTN